MKLQQSEGRETTNHDFEKFFSIFNILKLLQIWKRILILSLIHISEQLIILKSHYLHISYTYIKIGHITKQV